MTETPQRHSLQLHHSISELDIFVHPIPKPRLVLLNHLFSITIFADLERISEISAHAFPGSPDVHIVLFTAFDVHHFARHFDDSFLLNLTGSSGLSPVLRVLKHPHRANPSACVGGVKVIQASWLTFNIVGHAGPAVNKPPLNALAFASRGP
jgi:hypothetical protein